MLSKIKFLICANIVLLCGTASAQAGVWDWTFTGATSLGTGSFITNGETITSISGSFSELVGDTVKTASIDSLLAAGTFNGNDNTFNSSTGHFDASGVAFSTSSQDQRWVQLFTFPSGTDSVRIANPNTVFGGTSSPVTFTAAPSAVPWEPSDVAVIAGVALFGFQRLRRKRQAA